MAGVTTFMTMAIGAGLVTMAMGIFVNYPIALAPGMGLNAFYAVTVVISISVSWQVALGAVFISGLIFILLTVTRIRQLIVEGMPISLKQAITVGIGLFITVIGLKLSNIMTILLHLMARKVKGAMLIGILATTMLAIAYG